MNELHEIEHKGCDALVASNLLANVCGIAYLLVELHISIVLVGKFCVQK